MLKTPFTDRLNLDYPLMSAPMSNHSGGTLAAAVSQTGALGTFGGSNRYGPQWLTDQIAHIRNQTPRPFGIGFITHQIESDPQNFELALTEQVPVIIFSFADPHPWLTRARESGALTIAQVQSPESAQTALDAGADILLAQGNEAGGHTGQMNLLPLLADLTRQHPHTPILAAGGITSPQSLAAILAAGAQGASLGTALLATPEAIEVPQPFKDQILRTNGQETIYTRLYDLLDNAPWPNGIAGRVYHNRLTQQWHHRLHEIQSHREELTTDLAQARQNQDPETASVYMGQGVTQIQTIRPAAQIIHEIAQGAETILRQLPQILTPPP